jgi:hypothetical protein
MHHLWAVKVGEEHIRIVECEYYPWDDVFTHKHPRQKEIGTIYVHRSSSKPTSGYKNGSFKGVDITINGGILIRAIKDKDIIIEGPCNVVTYICEKMQWSLQHLEDQMNVVEYRWDDSPIFYGARVGLTLKRSDNLELWSKQLILPYRSSIVIPSKHKETFICVDIDRTDIKTPALKRWKEEYNKGKTMTLNKDMSLLQISGYLSK